MSELVLEKTSTCPGWKITQLKDICSRVSVGHVGKTSEYYCDKSKGILFLRTTNVKKGKLDLTNVKFITKELHKKLTNSQLEEGDLLIARVGGGNHEACIVPENLNPLNCANIILAKPLFKISKFLNYFFQSPLCIRQLHGMNTGSVQRVANTKSVEKINIPIPPLNEQKRIVEKIEELFSKIEYVEQSLRFSQNKLKQFTQSLLKNTYDELEKNYKNSTIDELSTKITDGEHLKPNYTKSGVPFVTAKNVREFGITFDDVDFISENDARRFHQKCHPEENDLLIVSRGATVGRLCLVNTKQQFCLLGSVILIKPSLSVIPKFLSYFLKSPSQRKELIKLSGSTAQQAIYLIDIKKTKIPLPPLEKQKEIVSRFDDYLSFVEKSTELVKSNLQILERSKSVILKHAFEGKLVPQDPNDESAKILLQQIKQEKEQLKQKEKSKKRKKNGR